MIDNKVIEIIRVFIKSSKDRKDICIDIPNYNDAINIYIINDETVCINNAINGKIFYLGSIKETTIYRTYEMIPECKEGEKIDG